MARWDHLFYCSRCDGVFDVTAAQRRLIPPSDMTHYLSVESRRDFEPITYNRRTLLGIPIMFVVGLIALAIPVYLHSRSPPPLLASSRYDAISAMNIREWRTLSQDEQVRYMRQTMSKRSGCELSPEESVQRVNETRFSPVQEVSTSVSRYVGDLLDNQGCT